METRPGYEEVRHWRIALIVVLCLTCLILLTGVAILAFSRGQAWQDDPRWPGQTDIARRTTRCDLALDAFAAYFGDGAAQDAAGRDILVTDRCHEDARRVIDELHACVSGETDDGSAATAIERLRERLCRIDGRTLYSL